MSNSLESSEFGANPVVYCGNYSLFEKQLLVYYWALVEAECQPWATKIPGSCNVHLYRADKVIKLGVQSHSPSSNPSSAYRIRLEQALKPQVSCMKKWPFTSFLSACTYDLFSRQIWSQRYDQLIREEKIWVSVTVSGSVIGCTTFKKELQHLQPLSGTSLKESVTGQNFEQSMWLFIFLRRENAR